MTEELAAQARRVISTNWHLTLATADADGVPWASPVYFAVRDDREYYRVSSPTARHSRNIEVRPLVGDHVIINVRLPGDARPEIITRAETIIDTTTHVNAWSRRTVRAGTATRRSTPRLQKCNLHREAGPSLSRRTCRAARPTATDR
jgi:hypothetical protein